MRWEGEKGGDADEGNRECGGEEMLTIDCRTIRDVRSGIVKDSNCPELFESGRDRINPETSDRRFDGRLWPELFCCTSTAASAGIITTIEKQAMDMEWSQNGENVRREPAKACAISNSCEIETMLAF